MENEWNSSEIENASGRSSVKQEDRKNKLQVPEGAEELPYQIAGHRFGKSKNKLGILKHSESRDILKPICDKRSKREESFYEELFSTKNDHDYCICALRKLVPHYNGLFHDNHMDIDYIRLEDVTFNMSHISILDIKMGFITYDPEASEGKRLAEMNKYQYAKDLGFRILGMRFYNRSTNEYSYKSKDYGLQVNSDNASQALIMFVQNDVNLLKQFQKQLIEIENWFRIHNIDRWKFISSSLLFSYGLVQSDPLCQTEKQGNHENSTMRAIIKMIDFAHVFPNVGFDENYLFGLNKLKFYLEKAIEYCV